MHRNTKVATCCYCGTRAALVLGKERHELICSNCGAPLGNLKSLRSDTPRIPAAATPSSTLGNAGKGGKPKKKKKQRKSGFRRLFKDLIDEIEDIID